jgi:hypothetical protein
VSGVERYKYTIIFNLYYQNYEDKKKKTLQKVNIHGLGPAVKVFHSPEVGMEMKVSDRPIVKEHKVEEDMFKPRRGTKWTSFKELHNVLYIIGNI